MSKTSQVVSDAELDEFRTSWRKMVEEMGELRAVSVLLEALLPHPDALEAVIRALGARCRETGISEGPH